MRNGGCRQYLALPNIKLILDTLDSDDTFNCTESGTISISLFNDLIFDCHNGKDEPLLLNIDRQSYNCLTANMIECYQGHTKCYTKEQRCQYSLDIASNTLLYCRNGQHLDDCETVSCNFRFKCPKSYCIPYRYICNGRWDCWNRYEEQNCFDRQCLGCLNVSFLLYAFTNMIFKIIYMTVLCEVMNLVVILKYVFINVFA